MFQQDRAQCFRVKLVPIYFYKISSLLFLGEQKNLAVFFLYIREITNLGLQTGSNNKIIGENIISIACCYYLKSFDGRTRKRATPKLRVLVLHGNVPVHKVHELERPKLVFVWSSNLKTKLHEKQLSALSFHLNYSFCAILYISSHINKMAAFKQIVIL